MKDGRSGGGKEYAADIKIVETVAAAFETHGFIVNRSDRSEAVYIRSGKTTVRLACHQTVLDGRREYENEVVIGRERRDGSYSSLGFTIMRAFLSVTRNFTKKERSLKDAYASF